MTQLLDVGTVRVGDTIRSLEVRPTHVQLFRFSAATWNAHRIHYDAEYARSEGYPDVLVHSHLHASYLCQSVLDWAGGVARLRRFRWENRAVATPGDALTCIGNVTDIRRSPQGIELDIEMFETRQDGTVCVLAWATVTTENISTEGSAARIGDNVT